MLPSSQQVGLLAYWYKLYVLYYRIYIICAWKFKLKKKKKNLCTWNQHQLNDSKHPKMFLMAREAFKFQRFLTVNILIVYVQTGFIVPV